MRVALRCDRHLHGYYDPETGVFQIVCRQCTKAQGRTVYHHWRMKDGTIQGMDHSDDSSGTESDSESRRSRFAPDAWR